MIVLNCLVQCQWYGCCGCIVVIGYCGDDFFGWDGQFVCYVFENVLIGLVWNELVDIFDCDICVFGDGCY